MKTITSISWEYVVYYYSLEVHCDASMVVSFHFAAVKTNRAKLASEISEKEKNNEKKNQ